MLLNATISNIYFCPFLLVSHFFILLAAHFLLPSLLFDISERITKQFFKCICISSRKSGLEHTRWSLHACWWSMHKNLPAFACIHAKAWPYTLWTLAPKRRCIIQEDWSRIVLSITSGYMVPMANYAAFNYISKLPVHWETWALQNEDKENHCTQQPEQHPLVSREALMAVLFLENSPFFSVHTRALTSTCVKEKPAEKSVSFRYWQVRW